MLRTSVRGAGLLILVVLLWMGQSTTQAQFPYSAPPESRADRQPHMRIVESRFTSTQSARYVTIAGGVKRSGVFSTDEAQVPLTTLLKAAGGLAVDGPATIRIYSSQLRPRAQLYFNGESPESVRAGEVVVVLRTHAQGSGDAALPADVIPVVCTGLIERPVVLPLHPDVANVPTLVQQLMQPRELLESIRRIDPVGRSSGWELYSGSILAFDPGLVNQVGLQSAQELPPSVSLLDALKPPAEPEPLPQNSVPEQPASVSAESRPSAFGPPLLPGAEDAEQGMKVTPMVVRNFGPQAHRERESAGQPSQLPPAMISSPEPRVAIISEPGISEQGISATVQDVTPLLPAPMAAPTFPMTAQAESPLTTTMVVPISSVSVPAASAEPTPAIAVPASPDSAGHKLATPPAAAESSPVITMPIAAAEPVAKSTTPAVTPTATANSSGAGFVTSNGAAQETERAGSSGLLTVALGVAVLMVLCLGVCIVWSHYDNMAFQKEQAACSALTSTTIATPGINDASTTPGSSLKSVIGQRLPVVEEPATLPAGLQIHGVAVGHRRLALHGAHQSLPGPHFGTEAKGSKGKAVESTVCGERQLRSQLRAILKGAGTAPASASPEYDVVQVESPRQHTKASIDSVEGALDRALRSISSEKQS